MMKNTTLTIILLIALLSFVACEKEESGETQGVPVESVQITSCVDLSQRTDWIFRFGYAWRNGVLYNYSAHGKEITTASPKENYYRFGPRGKEGEPVGNSGQTMYIRLVAPEYFPMDKIERRDTGPIPPAIQDQSTWDKIIRADALFCNYEGIITSHLTGLKFIHENALLEFEIVNMPEDVEPVILYNSGIPKITPYQADYSLYKVIILPHDSYTAVGVTIQGEPYSIPLGFNIEENHHYTFSLRFDEAKQELAIESVNAVVWSEEANQ